MLIKSRLSKALKMPLKSGAHNSLDEGACIMELVSYVIRAPWSDHPECVCPVLGAFMRSWNDGMRSDAEREMLKPLIPLLVGTRSTPEVENRRSWMACDWLVRVQCPAWLGLAGSFSTQRR